MTGKKKNSHSKAAQIGFVGYITWGPPARLWRGNWTYAFESQSSTKAVYKSPGGGSSAKLTKIDKDGGFVNKRWGNHGYKQEVNYKTSVKVNDKAQVFTTLYETQVKCKKTTAYNEPKKAAAAPMPVPYYEDAYY